MLPTSASTGRAETYDYYQLATIYVGLESVRPAGTMIVLVCPAEYIVHAPRCLLGARGCQTQAAGHQVTSAVQGKITL